MADDAPTFRPGQRIRYNGIGERDGDTFRVLEADADSDVLRVQWESDDVVEDLSYGGALDVAQVLDLVEA